MNPLLEQLRLKAKAATPGPWTFSRSVDGRRHCGEALELALECSKKALTASDFVEAQYRLETVPKEIREALRRAKEILG